MGNCSLLDSIVSDNYVENISGFVIQNGNDGNIIISGNVFTNNTFNDRDMLINSSNNNKLVSDNEYYNNMLNTIMKPIKDVFITDNYNTG